MRNTRVVGLIALTSLAIDAHAGVLVEMIKRDVATGKEAPLQIMEIQDGMARMEANGARRAISIFKNDTMYVLDTQRKTYMTLDRESAKQMANTMNDAMARMREQMASLPPDQRALMENMMKQQGIPMPGASAATAKAPVYDATPTGKSDTVNGRACKLWTVTRDGAPAEQLCVVPYAGLPGKDEFQQLAEKMRPLMQQLTSSFGRQFDGNPMDFESNLAKKLNGAPFSTRRYENGALSNEAMIVKTWKSQTLPAARFDIPADYRKQELPALPK